MKSFSCLMKLLSRRDSVFTSISVEPQMFVDSARIKVITSHDLYKICSQTFLHVEPFRSFVCA